MPKECRKDWVRRKKKAPGQRSGQRKAGAKREYERDWKRARLGSIYRTKAVKQENARLGRN